MIYLNLTDNSVDLSLFTKLATVGMVVTDLVYMKDRHLIVLRLLS